MCRGIAKQDCWVPIAHTKKSGNLVTFEVGSGGDELIVVSYFQDMVNAKIDNPAVDHFEKSTCLWGDCGWDDQIVLDNRIQLGLE